MANRLAVTRWGIPLLVMAVAVSSLGCASFKARGAFSRGKKAQDRGDLNEAIREYRDAVDNDPSKSQYKEALDTATGEGLREATRSVLGGLTAREAKVLRMRFGIDMNTDHTLEEVGKQFDVTRERIRQIEAKALRKLRHPSRSEHLRSFLDE